MILSLILILSAWSAEHPSTACVDRLAAQGLSKEALDLAFTRYYENKRFLPVSDHFLLADFSKNSQEKRLFLVNADTCRYFSTHLAHGKDSDRDSDGMVESCEGERSSPYGFFLVSGLYSIEKEYEEKWEDSYWWQKPQVFVDSALKSYSTIATWEEKGKQWAAQGINLIPLEGQNGKRFLMREGVEASIKNVRRFQGSLRNNGDLAIGPEKLRDMEKSLQISRGTLLLSYAPQCRPANSR